MTVTKFDRSIRAYGRFANSIFSAAFLIAVGTSLLTAADHGISPSYGKLPLNFETEPRPGARGCQLLVAHAQRYSLPAPRKRRLASGRSENHWDAFCRSRSRYSNRRTETARYNQLSGWR
jgi:hypothetical protein